MNKSDGRKKFSVAVCGAVLGAKDSSVKKKVSIIGQELALKGIIIRTGACSGYPNEAVKAAFIAHGETVGISPARNREDHEQKYQYPLDNFTSMVFTGLGIPGRNMPLIAGADSVIIVGGQFGTMIELGIAMTLQKPIGVLEGSGGITKIARQIEKVCRKKEKPQKIIYGKDPKRLVEKLVKVLKNG